MLFRTLATAFFLTAFSPAAEAAVWDTTRNWSAAEEEAFGQWIEALPLTVFTAANSPYKGISTDCADAAYTLRIIYAYENGLPVSFSGAGQTNASGAFDGTPAGIPRLKAFITYVNANTGTATLARDTYPIAINRRTLKHGTLFLHPEGGAGVPITYRAGHVYYISGLEENGMVHYFSSTVSTMVRDLQARTGINFAPLGKNGGYRAWKQPGGATPGLSEEQFSFANWYPNGYRDGDLWDKWTAAIRARLSLRPATADEEFSAATLNVAGYIKERAKLVQKSWAFYQKKYGGQGCMSAADYDAYSTPTRDVKIQSELEALRAAGLKYGGESSLRRIFASQRYTVLPGHAAMDLNQIWDAFMTEKVLSISEPEHSPAVRWGLEAQEEWPCPHRAKQYVGGERTGQF